MFLADSSVSRGTLTVVHAVSSYGSGTARRARSAHQDLDRGLEAATSSLSRTRRPGLTLSYLQDILRAREPRSLRTACLLSKPSRRKIDVKVEYIGFSIEDKFVVGYGLDFDERFRNLSYIGVMPGGA